MTRLAILLATFTSIFLEFAHAADVQDEITGTGITAFFPGDDSYAKASQAFNLRFTFQPAAVAYPTSTEEVSELVKIGRANDLKVVARSGGHSYIANGLGGQDGALVVDLSKITGFTVEPTTKRATIAAGMRLGDIALALNEAGRALPHGTCAYVGMGGHSGHGGFGFTSRMWGLTVDTITSVDVVLANGTIAKASKDVNADLFWAMRGSASSFGIATFIEVETFDIPSYAIVFQYNWQFTAARAASALGAFQSFVQTNIPAELGAEIVLTKGGIAGNVSFGLAGAWYGEEAKLNRTLQGFLEYMPTPNTHSLSGNGTYIDSVVELAGGSLDTSGALDGTDTFYAKSLMTPEDKPLMHAGRLALMSYVANEGFNAETGWFMQLELYGGRNSKINSVPLNETSFGRRNSMLTMQFYASSPGNQPPYPDSGFTFLNGLIGNVTASMPKNWDYGAYINYIDDKLEDWQTRCGGKYWWVRGKGCGWLWRADRESRRLDVDID